MELTVVTAPDPAMREACILLFTRVPRVGAVKTRLIPALGAAGACALHERLLRRVLEMLRRQGLGAVEVWTDVVAPCALIDDAPFPRLLQTGADLGARMGHASRAALSRFRHVLLIGSDCPGLDEAYLEQALAALRRGVDVVLGPAEDGGYVLLGLSEPHARLFEEMPWGTGEVAALTLRRCVESGLDHECLAPLRDIDTPDDLVFCSY